MPTADASPTDLIEQVMDVVAGQVAARREDLTPDTDLIRDLHVDSLDIVEIMLALEERFGVTIPEEGPRQVFLHRPATMRLLAEVIEECWSTGQADRSGWQRTKEQRHVEEEPFSPFEKPDPDVECWQAPLYAQIEPNQEGNRQFRRSTDSMKCVLLPGAEVWIGSGQTDSLPDQRPRHTVALSSFLMDAEPVSNAAYARFLNNIGPVTPDTLRAWCGPELGDDRGAQFGLVRLSDRWEALPAAALQPMILVSWYGAHAYALWAHRSDWRQWRDDSLCFLPTEAQWEYAARGEEACSHSFLHAHPEPTPNARVFGLHRAGHRYTADNLPAAPVSARLGMSPFGIHHMGGNVWQWCRDWYSPDYYERRESRTVDACNRAPSGIRSERGGSWVGHKGLTEPTYRRGRPPEAKGRCLGFRCAAPFYKEEI